jgi:hypothetical protein
LLAYESKKEEKIMLVVVSPAKKLDFETKCNHSEQTKPAFLTKTNQLAQELKKLNPPEIQKLMKLSPKLSELNFGRYQTFKKVYNPTMSKQAVFAFNGDTYTGLDINSFSKTQLQSAQKKLRILSGLYGLLKPMDLIQPYRLEMGTNFKFSQYKNLYEYWQDDITAKLNEELKKEKILINCASQEYFKAVDTKKLKGQIITPVFKEMKNGQLKIISFNAKKARGMFANFVIKNKTKTLDELKKFNYDKYKFSKEHSTDTEIIFVR